MKKLIAKYYQIMNWARNNVILKYFLNRELIAELWYKTSVYKALAMPAIIIKRRNIYSRAQIKALVLGITLAIFGLIPPMFWRDWFVFVLFFLLSIMFILKTPNIRAAANYSIFLYIFVAATLIFPPNSVAVVLLLGLLAIFGISFLVINTIDEPSDIYKILCGIYIAVTARAIYVSLDTAFGGLLQSGQDFSEFLIMLFPFAAAFVFLKRNKRFRWWLIIGLLPLVYGVVAILFDVGNVLQRQISEIPMDGNLIDVAMTAQGIFARGGTVGTQPFLDIYNAATAAYNSEYLFIRLFLYLGMFCILLYLWFIIRLIRKAVIQIFRQKGEARIVLIAGIIALFGAIMIIPFELERLSVRTMFIYWIVIGIVGGIVKNKVGIK